MQLTIKPIINNLFHAAVRVKGFQATAIALTKDEAVRKAVDWLKREIEVDSTGADLDAELILEDLDDDLSPAERALCTGDFLKTGLWQNIDPRVQKLAVEVARFGLRVTLGCTVRASVGGFFF